MNYLLIPIFGYVAAAYTTLIGYMVLFLIHYLLVRRMGKAFWYDTVYNFVYLAVFLVVMLSMQLFYNHRMLRYSLIALLLVGGILFLFKYWDDLAYSVKHRSVSKLIIHLKSFRQDGT